ncbi:MAG: TRAP transporter small permease [Syntrophobacteraceae bacterium]|jgi:TRAP-type C4-dicarboxylate transport system permease small subunit|nr:TRAP transporter small permease [Syntrophobacteraceae bacterium]
MDCQTPGHTPGPRTRIPVKIEESLAGIIIAVLALITFANVVVRYLTHFSFAFTEEISIFLMVVMTLVGSSSLMAKSSHLNITYFIDKLPPKGRRLARLAAAALTALTFLLLAILGGRMAWDEYRFEVTSPGLGIPTWVYTVWLPILSLVIVGRAAGLMARIARGED